MDLEHMSAAGQETGAMRTYLNDIIAASQLLADRTEDEQGRRCLAIINQASCRLLRVLQHRELLTKLNSMDSIQLEELDFAALCREVAEQACKLLGESGQKLAFHWEGSPLAIRGDGEYLRYMLYSLISNGVKAGGAVELRLTRTERSAVLTASDPGPETGGAALGRQLADGSPRPDLRPQAGAGTGLRLARRIVELHGGALVLTAAGDGRRAVVSLPLGSGGEPRLESPRLLDSGFDPGLVELSDVLPRELFLPERFF